MIWPKTWQETPQGSLFDFGSGYAFFGGRESGREILEKIYPNWSFWTLKQTHSNLFQVAPYEGKPPEGDALITSTPRIAACVRTADCMPVLIADPVAGMAAAIHAGWRGIENEIILRTCEELKRRGSDLSQNALVFIGPHIGRESFEVGLDVANRLANKLAGRLPRIMPKGRVLFKSDEGYPDQVTWPHKDSSKAYVDLLAIAHSQLIEAGCNPAQIFEKVVDTVTSSKHESFRRDKGSSARQISFIVFK